LFFSFDFSADCLLESKTIFISKIKCQNRKNANAKSASHASSKLSTEAMFALHAKQSFVHYLVLPVNAICYYDFGLFAPFVFGVAYIILRYFPPLEFWEFGLNHVKHGRFFA
jgi:hypothetical protein